MKAITLVFIGGGLGSVLRYLISKHFNSETNTFPWGTFSVNLFGSLLIGLVLGWVLHKSKLSSDTLLFVIAGFCGGFTTFSAFANESFIFLKQGNTTLFFSYVLSSIIAGLICVWLGYSVIKLV